MLKIKGGKKSKFKVCFACFHLFVQTKKSSVLKPCWCWIFKSIVGGLKSIIHSFVVSTYWQRFFVLSLRYMKIWKKSSFQKGAFLTGKLQSALWRTSYATSALITQLKGVSFLYSLRLSSYLSANYYKITDWIFSLAALHTVSEYLTQNWTQKYQPFMLVNANLFADVSPYSFDALILDSWLTDQLLHCTFNSMAPLFCIGIHFCFL